MEFVASSSGSTINAVGTTDRPAEKGYNRGENPSDFPDLDYTHTFYGTSAATPQVSAVLALIYSMKPTITSNEAFQILRDSADKIQPGLAAYDANGHSQTYGFGRINAGKAVTAASLQSE
jgi:subtilisin family serine protease